MTVKVSPRSVIAHRGPGACALAMSPLIGWLVIGSRPNLGRLQSAANPTSDYGLMRRDLSTLVECKMSIVVVGVVDMPTADDAAFQAAELARRLGAALHLVSATKQRGVTTAGAPGEQYVFGNIDLAQQYQAALKVRLGDAVEITSSVIDGNPGSALCAEAKRLDAEIIVVGSRRTQGMGRVLGSIASDVIKQAPCAVYVAQTSS